MKYAESIFRLGAAMYIPKFNEETRTPVLHQLMRERPLASLITYGRTGLFASHLPMVLDDQAAPLSVLRCHVSRANAQWKDFDPAVEALAIFSGAEHYITPNWYEEKQATGRVVPTWNYAVVHAYGHLKVVEDAEWLRAHVESLVRIHEASVSEKTGARAWEVGDAPAEYVASLIKGIVGFEMKIARLEGKWKVSQNQSENNRRGVMEGLDALETAESEAMARLVEDTLRLG
jgi:transcriptional regulator